MEERDFFDERPEQRTHTMTCPHCGQPGEYQIGWLVRRKKAQLRGNADERDRARFAKAQSYMVRTDDVLACKNIRCRKRFDVAGIQSVAFLVAQVCHPERSEGSPYFVGCTTIEGGMGNSEPRHNQNVI